MVLIGAVDWLDNSTPLRHGLEPLIRLDAKSIVFYHASSNGEVPSSSISSMQQRGTIHRHEHESLPTSRTGIKAVANAPGWCPHCDLVGSAVSTHDMSGWVIMIRRSFVIALSAADVST